MARIDRQPGRNYAVTITVKDEAGTPLNWADVAGFAIILSIDRDRVLAQWSKKADVDSFLNMEQVGPDADGKVRIIIPADSTADLNNVQSYLEGIRQELDGSETVLFGMKDGKKKEFIYFTTTALTQLPDIME